MIRRIGNRFHIMSEDGKKHLGDYPTKEQAEKRLKQIEYFKHAAKTGKTKK